MKVLINRTLALRRKSGIGHYVASLLRCLEQQAGADDLLLYPGRWTRLGLEGCQRFAGFLKKFKKARSRPAGGAASLADRDRVSAWGRRLQDWHFRVATRSGDFDLYHEPNTIAFPCSRPTIVTVHDLSLLLHPQWHPTQRVRHFTAHFARGLAQAAHVITVSEFTRQEVLRHLQLSPTKVTCTYNGVRDGLGPLPPHAVLPVLRRLGLPDQYLLHVGTLEPRKNLTMLLRAYMALPATVRERCPLVLAGGWGWNTEELAELYQKARPLGVMHLGYIADEDLSALYNGARALVFPTHYEGFGLPPVEMMACGGAVLASTAGAVAETVGAKAHLVDPLDEEGWRHAMERVIMDDDWRRQLRQGAIELVRPFTWERCAADTWQVYRQVLGVDQAGGKSAKAA